MLSNFYKLLSKPKHFRLVFSVGISIVFALTLFGLYYSMRILNSNDMLKYLNSFTLVRISCYSSGEIAFKTTPTKTSKPVASISRSYQDLVPTRFCPLQKDIIHTWGDVQVHDQGWTIQGAGGVGLRSSFNLIGGSIEYNIDISRVRSGVNTNLYSVFRSIPHTGYDPTNSFDICYGTDEILGGWCPEIDWIESNGSCGGTSTIYSSFNRSYSYSFLYQNNTRLHMKVAYEHNGSFTIQFGQQTFNSSMFDQIITDDAYRTIINEYQKYGALIHSSQWVGWVPVPECGSSGNLTGSIYTVSDLIITGSVVQGPTPNICAA